MVPLYDDETVPLPLRVLACVNIEVGFSREPRRPSSSTIADTTVVFSRNRRTIIYRGE